MNQQIVALDTKIKNGDLIVHKAHRHEPPVSGEPIAIVHEDDDVVCLPMLCSTMLVLHHHSHQFAYAYLL